MDENEDCYCPHFHRAIELIGQRWTGAILQSMLGGTTRFSDIRDGIPGLSDRLLSERLKSLEEAGVVQRCIATGDVAYYLTDLGQKVEPVFEAVGGWAKDLAAVATLES